MATKNYRFTGPVKWAKIWPGQLDRKFAYATNPLTGEKTLSPAGGKWDIIINLDAPQLMMFNALGTKTKAARLDDPERGITKGDVRFKRNERHPSLGELGPVIVTGVAEGTAIGNDSTCEVSVEVYDYPQPDGTRAFACRLVSVDVLNLVQYVKPGQGDEVPF